MISAECDLTAGVPPDKRSLRELGGFIRHRRPRMLAETTSLRRGYPRLV
jgi:hypothetical protein